MALCKSLSSPKRVPSSDKKSVDFYHYYAGFSPKFVRDVLTCIDINPNAIIMDPWNGSGTTTQVARNLGFSAIGFDINPVMIIVAKAKLLNCTNAIKQKLLLNLKSIIETAESFQGEQFLYGDPLETWVEPESAICFRDFERAVQLRFIGDQYTVIYARKSLASISDIASFYYLALFKTLRKFLIAYVSSNPTWIKKPLKKDELIHPTSEEIYMELQKQVHDMMNALVTDELNNYGTNSAITQIERASSESIPLPNSSVDIVISSPPYCTRIDYAVATSPELAMLGCSMENDLKILRDSMIGTPTINGGISKIKSEWGPSIESFLKIVEIHDSKAAKSYYHKNYIQYFNTIYNSLGEINRTLVKSGQCILVVQDSYFKGIRNDLPKMYCEMANSLGWVMLDRIDYPIKRTMAGCNRRAKKYRSGSEAIESVLIFKKNERGQLHG